MITQLNCRIERVVDEEDRIFTGKSPLQQEWVFLRWRSAITKTMARADQPIWVAAKYQLATAPTHWQNDMPSSSYHCHSTPPRNSQTMDLMSPLYALPVLLLGGAWSWTTTANKYVVHQCKQGRLWLTKTELVSDQGSPGRGSFYVPKVTYMAQRRLLRIRNGTLAAAAAGDKVVGRYMNFLIRLILAVSCTMLIQSSIIISALTV